MLKLDDLFQLFEEVEATQKTLSEFAPSTKTGEIAANASSGVEASSEEKTIKIPRLHISENWGKLDNPDRNDLRMTLVSAGATPGEPFASLEVIEGKFQELLQQIETKSQELKKNPGKVLSLLIVADTLNRLFNSFQSSPTGFINEAFMSVLYDGQQIEAGEGNLEQQIGDVIDKDGTPISVKTISSTTDIGGSINNLIESLKKSPTKKVYFDIFIKDRGEDKEVVSFAAYRFHVDRENAKELLKYVASEKEISDILNEEPKDYSISALAPEIASRLRQAGWTEEAMAEINKALNLRNGENLAIDKDTKEVTGITKRSPQARVEALRVFALKKGLVKPEEAESFKAALESLLSGLEAAAKRKGETQFSFPQRVAIQLSKNQKYPSVTINFSKERINKLLNGSLEVLRESVFELFGQVEDFSNKLTQYFTSTAPDRGSTFGKSAVKAAEEVKEKTTKTVSDET